MIRQLMRCDPAWGFAPWLAPLGVAAGLWLDERDTLFVSTMFLGALAMLSRPYERATLFTAALPVPARQLFLARLCASFAVWWLPAIAATMAAMLAGRSAQAVLGFPAASLAVTAWTLVLLSLRPREFSASGSMLLKWTALTWVGVIPIARQQPAMVAGVCAVVAIVFFWRTWNALPAAFQIASEEPARVSTRVGIHLAPAVAWFPVVRALVSLLAFCWLPILILQASQTQWLYSTMMAFCAFTVAVGRSHWVLTLPFRRSPLLAIVMACSVAPVLLGYGRFLWFENQRVPAPTAVLTVGAILCVFLLFCNGLLVGFHHRYRRLPSAAKAAWIAIAAAPFVAAVADGVWRRGAGFTHLAEGAFQWMGAALPPNLAMVAAAAFVPAAVLYWTATRLFAGIEIVNARCVSAWEAMSQK